MDATHPGSSRLVLTLRWSARILAAVLVYVWGGFFLHHLWEWFSDPANLPPPFVFVAQGLHLLFLLGLLVGWRWEVPGALLVLAGAVPFFWIAAGPNFLLFASVTCLPALLWVGCAILTRTGVNSGGSSWPAAR